MSAERIEADIETLVSFGTRHTASETESETRGIGAARRWMGPDGGLYNVTHKLEGGALVERIVGVTNSSTTKKVYTLSEDGARLTIRVTIKHKMLPKVLRYRHSYRRA